MSLCTQSTVLAITVAIRRSGRSSTLGLIEKEISMCGQEDGSWRTITRHGWLGQWRQFGRCVEGRACCTTSTAATTGAAVERRALIVNTASARGVTVTSMTELFVSDASTSRPVTSRELTRLRTISDSTSRFHTAHSVHRPTAVSFRVLW